MALISENHPIMTLIEETLARLTFQFKGRAWAAATIFPGFILLAVAIYLAARGNPNTVILAIVGLLGTVLIYSSLTSLTSTQWLTADSSTRTIKFYKKNIYGLVAWEKSAGEFKAIHVGRSVRSTNWNITIITNDGDALPIGENVFGAFNFESALELANKVSRRTGIKVDAPSQF